MAQVVWVAHIEGWDCSAVSTLTTHICGLWGYEKAVPSMSGRTLLKLTPAQCNQIVKRGVFKTAQGRTITGISAPGYTTTQYNVRGWDGIRNGDAAYLGMKSFKTNTGEELERTVQSMYIKFTIRRITLKADRKSKVMTVAGSGKKLACALGESDIPGAPKSAGCAGVGQTFVWPQTTSSYCPLHFVRSIKGILTRQTFVSPQHMVAFTVTGRR